VGVGIIISVKKTDRVYNVVCDKILMNMTIEGSQVKKVHSFKYIDVRFNSIASCDVRF